MLQGLYVLQAVIVRLVRIRRYLVLLEQAHWRWAYSQKEIVVRVREATIVRLMEPIAQLFLALLDTIVLPEHPIPLRMIIYSALQVTNVQKALTLRHPAKLECIKMFEVTTLARRARQVLTAR